MKRLTLGSLFDGSGGFPLGGLICGIEPIWSSEILPFAIRVTTKRLPQVKHYGDISKLNGADLPPVDIITFGSPCQSVSIAGRRDGIKHTAHGDDVTTRSGLFFEAIRVIKEMRCATNDQYPRYIVFENVAGIFSSSNCEDFRTVLEEICSIKETDVHIPRPEKKWHYAGEIVGSLGEHWTRNTSMCHSEGRDVFLSEILEVQVPPKYYLSQRACLGILRRAASRGKKLPPLLKKALEQQAERMALP